MPIDSLDPKLNKTLPPTKLGGGKTVKPTEKDPIITLPWDPNANKMTRRPDGSYEIGPTKLRKK